MTFATRSTCRAVLVAAFFTANVSAQQLSWETTANNGTIAPGGDPAATFRSYNQPALNNAGVIVFRARSSTGSGAQIDGIYQRDLNGPNPVVKLLARDDVVPDPNNTFYMGTPASFTEFPSTPRIDQDSGLVATRGQHQPVWTYMLGETETRIGTAGIYAFPLGTPVTGASLLGSALEADQVIVTASTGVLAMGGIKFSPDLPENYDAAFDGLAMGLLTKIPLLIEGERFGLSAFDDLLIERRSHHDIYFLCFPFDLPLMVGFVGGDFAWEIECQGEDVAVEFATERLVRTFGSNARKAVKKGSMTKWGSERWTHGAYAAARPGQAHSRDVLAVPVADRIHFAGEALGGPLMQTCAGARLSGERAARAILEVAA